MRRVAGPGIKPRKARIADAAKATAPRVSPCRTRLGAILYWPAAQAFCLPFGAVWATDALEAGETGGRGARPAKNLAWRASSARGVAGEGYGRRIGTVSPAPPEGSSYRQLKGDRARACGAFIVNVCPTFVLVFWALLRP